ncbi:MAG: hypothetical protein M3O46_07355 [Myxococcota bacterium]|nr:hypothetical protein [Myxococcota bacterium]
MHLARADFDEQFDPELVALPDPSRQGRALTVSVLGVAALAALAMVLALRHDVAYAMTVSTAASLGDLRIAGDAALTPCENRFVHGESLLGAAGGIRYERLFSGDTFRAMPVAGRRDIWVEVRVPEGQESGRWEPPREFTGRLVRFEAGGPRHRGLASAIERTTHERLPSGAWLLVDSEDPARARWVLVLAATFLSFAAWHLAAIAKMVRKLS